MGKEQRKRPFRKTGWPFSSYFFIVCIQAVFQFQLTERKERSALYDVFRDQSLTEANFFLML